MYLSTHTSIQHKENGKERNIAEQGITATTASPTTIIRHESKVSLVAYKYQTKRAIGCTMSAA